MEIKQVMKLLGAKRFKGNVEGVDYDSTKLYVVMEVSERNGTEVGFNAAQLVFGKSDNYDKVKDLPLPCDVNLTISMTTKGLEVVGFHGQAKPGMPAAA